MYIISGKGTVAGIDLGAYILQKCRERGVLWDDDLPEYTLDFLTQTPSVSKSIREGKSAEVISIFNRKLKEAESSHSHYMLLCLTAHQLIPELDTKLECINLWESVSRRIDGHAEQIAFIGTLECLPEGFHRFVTLPNHSDAMGDLITSVKRGYAALGDSYAAHPRHLLKAILNAYSALGVGKYFLACTDLHLCKQYLLEFGVPEADIVDVLEVAGDEVLARNRRKYDTGFLDDVSDAKTHFRYKYLDHSDSLQTDRKTEYFHRLVGKLGSPESDEVEILDIGGSSTGHSLELARRFSPARCNITLQDISQQSLDAAKPLYLGQPNVAASFECGNIATFSNHKKFDVILCLGVLLCVSRDPEFEAVVSSISRLAKPGGVVITRDCLTDSTGKIYMAFGGVIRNEQDYIAAFRKAGFDLIEENAFVIEQPIRRTIKSVIWKKH